MNRQRFPQTGIYAVQGGGLASSHYLIAADQRRYRYVRPAYPDLPKGCVLADCWIVDAAGRVNPGTNVSPIPVSLEQIGRRLTNGSAVPRKIL